MSAPTLTLRHPVNSPLVSSGESEEIRLGLLQGSERCGKVPQLLIESGGLVDPVDGANRVTNTTSLTVPDERAIVVCWEERIHPAANQVLLGAVENGPEVVFDVLIATPADDVLQEQTFRSILAILQDESLLTEQPLLCGGHRQLLPGVHGVVHQLAFVNQGNGRIQNSLDDVGVASTGPWPLSS